MRTLFCCIVVAAFCAPALGRDLRVQEMDNGDGSFTYSFEIDTPNEVAYMELTIMGNLHQVQSNSSFFDRPWAPTVVFISDFRWALHDGDYADNRHLDTLIDDDWWPGKVAVELTPNIGDGNIDGTEGVHVAMTTFTGGIGAPLPGGFVPLAHVTTWGRNLWVHGQLQSNTDPEGHFEWHIPEPSALLLGVMGMLGSVATRRHRRHQSVAR